MSALAFLSKVNTKTSFAQYGWRGSPGEPHNTMHCRTVLSYQAVYGGYAVMVGDGRYPGTDASVRDEASGKMRLNSTELAWRASHQPTHDQRRARV